MVGGSKFIDRIMMGLGSNRITGGEGEDIFVGDSNCNCIDTLIESFGTSDSTFVLSNDSLKITFEQLTTTSNDDGSVESNRKDVTDIEDMGVDLFENLLSTVCWH